MGQFLRLSVFVIGAFAIVGAIVSLMTNDYVFMYFSAALFHLVFMLWRIRFSRNNDAKIIFVLYSIVIGFYLYKLGISLSVFENPENKILSLLPIFIVIANFASICLPYEDEMLG